MIACSFRLRRPRSAIDAAIEHDLVLGFDLVRKALLDLRERDRRRQQDAAVRGGAGQLADGEERRARQRRRLLDRGAAAVGQHERAVAAIARDAIGKRQRQQHAGRQSPRRAPGDCHAELRTQRFAMLRALRRALRAIAAKPIEPCVEIDIVAAEPALAQHRRDLARLARRAPSRAASTIMRASRGGSGSARRLLPSAVMRPSASSASSSRSSARRLVPAPAPAADRGTPACADR